MKITITATGLDPVKASMIRLQSASVRKIAVMTGAQDALEVVEKYYNSNGSRLWENPSLPTHGPGRKKTQWWRKVAGSWSIMGVSGSGVTLRSKGAIGFSHKVTGGTITARRAKFLTIPIVPEAHGLTARTYSRTIAPLFAVKGVLAQADENSPTGIKPVFVLKKSITQKPWKNALPPEKTYLDAFTNGALESIIAQIEGTT
jgi:hypothetical protein